jgi:hypothetical protein
MRLAVFHHSKFDGGDRLRSWREKAFDESAAGFGTVMINTRRCSFRRKSFESGRCCSAVKTPSGHLQIRHWRYGLPAADGSLAVLPFWLFLPLEREITCEMLTTRYVLKSFCSSFSTSFSPEPATAITTLLLI